ncbi:MAG: hypothetical protein JSV82_09765 [Planctomycetota bacterium]|nr:MAG: hypothetical protein JSV82_09765 [Planctomycetota bacterium]
MKKFVYLVAAGSLLLFVQTVVAQQDELKFIEFRQEFADNLTSVKNAVRENDWVTAQQSFDQAKDEWENQVKPMIVEGRQEEIEKARQEGIENPEDAPGKLKEYSDRIGEVEENFSKLAQLLKNKEVQGLELTINAIIWGISHQPRGFDIPHRTYSVWDWVFGLGIGGGFCIFAIVAGLYLRRSYYRRYQKLEL